tara:strand:- start:337 stop:1080 length:744 start_codon:yes stop_codon:yes gene_type:complete
MKAIILAAGRGSRMKELTSEIPKCLLKINNKPLIEIQIAQFKKAGINDICIVTGYKNELLSKYPYKKIKNNDWASTQMVTSLMQASDWINESPFVVSYSDIFYEASAIHLILRNNENLSILYDLNWRRLWEKRFSNPLDDAETFRIDQNSFLTEIGNKTNKINDIQGQYMGILYFSEFGWKSTLKVINSLDQSQIKNLDMTNLLKIILSLKEIKIKAIPYKGIWGEVDNKKDLYFYNDNFKSFKEIF